MFTLTSEENESTIERMCSLSNRVYTFISEELYKEVKNPEDLEEGTVSEDYMEVITQESILADCYELLILELSQLGIVFNVELSELLQDFYTAKNIIVLLETIHPAKLYRTFNDHPSLAENIEDYLMDDEFDKNRLIVEIMEMFENHFPLDEDMVKLYDWGYDKVSNNHEFFLFIKESLDQIEHTKTEVISPELLNRAEHLFGMISTTIMKCTSLVNSIMRMPKLPVDGQLLFSMADRINAYYVVNETNLMEAINWANYRTYRTTPDWLKLSDEDIDEEQAKLTEETLKKKEPYYKEYYIENNLPIGLDQVVCLMMGYLNLKGNLATYKGAIINDLMDPNIVTLDTKDNLKDYVKNMIDFVME